MRLDHGDEYRGTVRDGVPHGKGSLYYTNGNSYEGSLQEGLKWGRGIFRWRNGDCYKGEFVRDVFHGHGTFSFANSTVTYTGAFREGMFIGPMPDASRGNLSETPMGRPPAQAPSPSMMHPLHRGHMGSPSERSLTQAIVRLCSWISLHPMPTGWIPTGPHSLGATRYIVAADDGGVVLLLVFSRPAMFYNLIHRCGEGAMCRHHLRVTYMTSLNQRAGVGSFGCGWER